LISQRTPNVPGRIAAAVDSAVAEIKTAIQGLIDASALPLLAPLADAYLPWTGASMRAGGVVAILNDIVIGRRRRIVECGSGITTIWIARLLQRHDGLLLSIEHDPEWASIVRDLLAFEQLNAHVTILDAPLTQENHSAYWYDRAALEEIMVGPEIDLLIVDGPPASSGREARYPAVPVFFPKLSADATIVLDDVNRADERRTLRRWEAEWGLHFQRRRSARIAIACRGRYTV
jgi:predicted O-methyltransferase YrrM